MFKNVSETTGARFVEAIDTSGGKSSELPLYEVISDEDGDDGKFNIQLIYHSVFKLQVEIVVILMG